MYQYNNFDKNFISERVEQYRDQTARYLKGEISDEAFQQLRLRNGLYIQRLAPMLRIAVPYGAINSEQLRAIAEISRVYDKGYGHLSTRQNIQLNWPELEEVPDILADLAEVGMHAIQTSGSCVRNVTTDQFSGVSADELVDGRPYCELLRQWSTFHPEFEWLPRKFKIAINGAKNDRAAIAVHDIGINAKLAKNGKPVLDVYVGGGLGRTPVIGSLIKEDLEEEHLLTYVEAILRVYNRYGRRDNKYKARIKILVRAMTAEAFKIKVDEEWHQLKDGPSKLTTNEIERIKSFFVDPEYPLLENSKKLDAYAVTLLQKELGEQRLGNRVFNTWVANNVAEHKRPGYAIVTLSTKPTGVPPGDVTDTQMDKVAEWADKYGFGEIRISHDQNFVLPDIPQQHLYELFQEAEEFNLGQANIGTLTDVICCPGGDYCSLANAKSIPVAEEIQDRFDDYDFLHDLGPLDLNISGCMNACGHHHVGHIGILGVDKKGSEFYQISLGGNQGNGASLGAIVGPSVSRHEVADVVEKVLDVYVDRREGDETFLSVYRRIGIDPFKARIYDDAS